MPQSISLDITGMTCAGCVARIENKLGKLGATATVNLATGTAAVAINSNLSIDDVIASIQAAGYSASLHQQAPSESPPPSLDARLVVSAGLGLAVVLLSMIPGLSFPGWQWVCAGLTTPVVTWGAWGFHRGMVRSLRSGTATMDTLISLGVSVSYLWSLYALIAASATSYMEVAAVITVLILFGRYLEARATTASSSAIRQLLSLSAKQATVVKAGVEIDVPIAQLGVDDEFVVRAGQMIASDGIVVEGHSSIDESLLTGESMPRDVGPTDRVVGATLNLSGRLIVRTTRIGQDTQLSQMSRLIEQAQLGKAPVQRLADKVAAVFVPVVIVVAIGTILGWLLITGNPSAAVAAAISVLVIACPCALGLATPAGLMVGTGRGAQLGILIRGSEILQAARRIDTIVIDKTGTITTGQLGVVDVITAPGVERNQLMQVASALESASTHPLAQAIADAAQGLPSLIATDLVSHGGLGVQATIGSPSIGQAKIGRLSWVNSSISSNLQAQAQQGEASGYTVVAIAWKDQVQGLITVADTIRSTSAQAVSQFRSMGLTPHLVTGDNPTVAAAIGCQVGIEEVLASMLPQDKVAVIQNLQQQGHLVAAIGDGINDAAALAQADLGIAMGAGADVAIEASDITLIRSDLLTGLDAVRLARAIDSRIRTNLFWAFAYNVAAIPLAVFGLLNPMIAGAAMALSSIFVLQNSLWLKRFKPTIPNNEPAKRP